MNDFNEPSITHYVLNLPEFYPINGPFVVKNLLPSVQWHQIIKHYARWFDVTNNVLDHARNSAEQRAKVMIRRGWLDDVLRGTLRAGEEGRWRIWFGLNIQSVFCALTLSLRSELEVKRDGSIQGNQHTAAGEKVRLGTNPRTRPRGFDLSLHLDDDSINHSYLSTPPLSAVTPSSSSSSTQFHSNPTFNQREREPSQLSSSPFLDTPPPSTTALRPAWAGSNIVPSANRFIEFCPPRDPTSDYKTSSYNQGTTGLFTPPPSASPPPGMRSPEYIMIPKQPLPDEGHAWHAPFEGGFVGASPKYDTEPSPTYGNSPSYENPPSPMDDIPSPSYSPIPTPAPASPSYSVDSEVELESDETLQETFPAARRQEDFTTRFADLGDPIQSNPSRPPSTNRQVSFNLKRPRPRSPAGEVGIGRPLAKRPSLQGMRARSMSDSPLSPAPTENEELEEGEIIAEENEDADEEGSEEDEEVEETPNRSPSPSVANDFDPDSDSDSELGLQPEEFDEVVMNMDMEMNVDNDAEFPSTSNSNFKAIESIDSTCDLKNAMIICDHTTSLAKILKSWN